MEKLLGILQKQDIKVTDALKQELQNIWDQGLAEAKEAAKKDTGDLLTQDQVNKIVQDRLARERSSYEGELKELRGKMEGLVDPSKVEEVKSGFEEQVQNLQKQQQDTKKAYELKLAAERSGVKDPDYFDYLVQKEGLYDRIKIDEGGTLYATDTEGNFLVEDGKKLGPSRLVGELKEIKPDLFGVEEPPLKKTTGATTPPPGGGKDTESIGIKIARERAQAEEYNPWAEK